MRQASPTKKQMLLAEPIKSLIPKMAVPPIIAQLITTVYNLVDTYFVSTLGTGATAAVGVCSSLEHLIPLAGSLIGAGACSYIARLLGAGRDEDAHRVLSTSFFTGAGIGVLFALVGSILIGPLVKLLGANPDSEAYAVQYATYVLLAAPFMIGSFILNMCLRSEGSSTYAMVGIAAGGVLNCFLDPLFIYTLRLGVAGASMATAISKLVSFCILVWPYIRERTAVRIALRRIKFVAQDVREVLSIGSTLFLRSALSVVSMVLINRIAGSFSTSTQAAVSIANRVMNFPFAIILGFGQGFQPVVGFNWGAERFDRVQEGTRFSIIAAVAGAVVMGAALFAVAAPIVRLFNSEADAEVLRIGVLCVRLQCLTMPFHAFESVVNMFYSGAGKAKFALLLSTARQGYVFLPVALIVPLLFGVNGVAACQAVADLFTFSVSLPLGIKAFHFMAPAFTVQTETLLRTHKKSDKGKAQF